MGLEIRISAFSGNSTSSTLPLITYIYINITWHGHLKDQIMNNDHWRKLRKNSYCNSLTQYWVPSYKFSCIFCHFRCFHNINMFCTNLENEWQNDNETNTSYQKVKEKKKRPSKDPESPPRRSSVNWISGYWVTVLRSKLSLPRPPLFFSSPFAL